MTTHIVNIKIDEIKITKISYYKGRPQTLTEPRELPEIEVLEPEDFEPTFEQLEKIEHDFVHNFH